MDYIELQKLKLELAVKSKRGCDFILAAAIVWLGIAIIWTTSLTAYNKSIITFIVGSLVLPLAFVFSKLLKTDWKVANNPLKPLGLWLNFAQLFYFPFLIFVLLTLPEYFVMTYAIITGAHLFPYAWFYDDTIYAIVAGVMSASSLIIGLNTSENFTYFLPFAMSVLLLTLFVCLWISVPTAILKWEEISNNNHK